MLELQSVLRNDLEDLALIERQDLQSKIPKEWLLDKVPTPDVLTNIIEFVDSRLTKEANDITSSTLRQLSEKITKRQLTSLEIVKAFSHRSAIIHQLVNNLSEIFFEESFEYAKRLDSHFSVTGKTVGPLHCLPISLKDQINLEGLDSSIGFVGLVGKRKIKEEPLLLPIS